MDSNEKAVLIALYDAGGTSDNISAVIAAAGVHLTEIETAAALKRLGQWGAVINGPKPISITITRYGMVLVETLAIEAAGDLGDLLDNTDDQ